MERTADELIAWLEEQACFSLISDDGGHWACVVEGFQSVPEGAGPQDIETCFWAEAADWRDTIREAIEMRIAEQEATDGDR